MPATSTNAPTSIREVLKRDTSALHQAVEDAVAITRPGLTLADYKNLLKAFWTALAALEEALDRQVQANIPSYYPLRRRTPSLERDLNYFGIDPHRLPQRKDVPRIGDVAGALGALYVIEGSTLGGQVISRHLEKKLGVKPGRGGSFFAGYGDATGKMWRGYLEALEHYATDENRGRMVRAAQDTFRYFLRAF